MKKSIGVATLVSAIGLALMPIAPAFAENWVYVTESSSNADWYYDSDTIRRSGNQITVWVKVDHSRDKTVKYRMALNRYRCDCAERTTSLLEWTDYYPDGKTDTVTVETYRQKEVAARPGSVMEDMLEAVCR
jgi:hypothetical protein